MKRHPFRHLRLILKHRHRVIYNGAHCGIFWHCLKHDLSKFSAIEFWTSAKYYTGTISPVAEERLSNHYYSRTCQHHSKRNAHHWEYWTDFFLGRILSKTMPWKYATEYFCDMMSASYCYDPKHFTPEKPLAYLKSRLPYYYMTTATKEYLVWMFTRFIELGWKGVKKKDTKAKYQEIISAYPDVELFEVLTPYGELPKLKEGSIITSIPKKEG